MPELAARARELGTESAFEVLARARALEATGRSILHLEIGEPDFPTPPHVVAAAAEALRAGATRYVQAAGLPELRAAIARDVTRRTGRDVPPERVVVTAGAKAVLLFTILCTVEPGDEVLLPDPGFPIYESAVRLAGGVPIRVPLSAANGFRLRAEDVAARLGPRTALVLCNSPGNPTGSAVPGSELRALVDLARARDLWLCSDEIYGQLTFGPAPSLFAQPGAPERTVLLDGFSKAHAMTGWRLGYAVLPEALVEPFVRLNVNSVSCVPPFVQAAGIAALEGDQGHVAAMCAEYRARRDAVVSALRPVPGIRCAVPDGAFYVFPDVSALGRPSAEVAEALLQEAGVAVLPGTCFGPGGEGHLRLSCAAAPAVLAEAVERIEHFMRAHGAG
jgi:aspartate/methionine/tyrosine aminotransferase